MNLRLGPSGDFFLIGGWFARKRWLALFFLFHLSRGHLALWILVYLAFWFILAFLPDWTCLMNRLVLEKGSFRGLRLSAWQLRLGLALVEGSSTLCGLSLFLLSQYVCILPVVRSFYILLPVKVNQMSTGGVVLLVSLLILYRQLDKVVRALFLSFLIHDIISCAAQVSSLCLFHSLLVPCEGII